MEARDPVNEQSDSEASDDATYASVDKSDEQLESNGPEDRQLNLHRQEDVSFEAPDGTGEQPEPVGPEDGQLDLQDQQSGSIETTGATYETQEPVDPEAPETELVDRVDGEPGDEEAEDDRLASENLVSDQLDLLFAEINRAVGIIGRLREQIAGLEQRNGELRQRLEEQDQVINGLQAERERLRSIYDNNASLIENKEEIQRKIETMISRLDSVNTA
ncbi:MAG: hypothetical protein OXU79_02330 [Gemmatimonadota bacterium]|nr:hypothetical protein [Gemmatimonadota bacterium]